MNKNLVAFTLGLIVLSVAICWGVLQFATPSYLFLIVGVLAATTFAIYLFFDRTSGENLIRNYLLTIVLKLLAGGTFISILIFKDVDHSEANAISFMIAYLLFTGIEVGFLFRKFKRY